MWFSEVLTLISDPEADVRMALVCREEQVEEVGGANEKLRHLGTLVTTNHWRGGISPVPHLQHVIVNLCPKPTGNVEIIFV